MSDKDDLIEFDVIALETPDVKPDLESKFSFDNQLDAFRKKNANIKTDMIKCPFCTAVFKMDISQFHEQKTEHTLQTCPECASVLKIFRKNKK